MIKGHYRFSQDRQLLTLTARTGGEQILYREPYAGKVYWVEAGERVLIRGKSEKAKWLRENSLRTEKP